MINIPVLIVLLIITILTLHKPKSFLFFVIVTFFAGIRIGAQLTAFEVLTPILVIYILLLKFNYKEYRAPKVYKKVYVWLLLFVVLLTMFYRGIGFQALGSEKIGGIFYVRIIDSLFLLIVFSDTQIKGVNWKALVICFLCMAIVPFFSDVLYFFSRGLIDFSNIFQGATTITQNLQNFDEGQNLFRIQSGATAGINLLFINFLVTQKNKKVIELNNWFIFLIILSIILVGISGHRLAFIELIILIFLFYYLDYRTRLKLRFILKLSIFSIITIFVIAFFSSELPESFARIISFIPFVKTKAGIEADATGSVDFRLIMWAMSLTEIPKYLIIGKGLAVKPIQSIMTNSGYYSSLEWFFDMGALHNGPLGMLLNFGVAGFIFGIAVFVHYLKKSINLTKKLAGTGHYLVAKVLIINAAINVIVFILFYGDMQTNFPDVIFSLAFIALFLNSVLNENNI